MGKAWHGGLALLRFLKNRPTNAPRPGTEAGGIF